MEYVDIDCKSKTEGVDGRKEHFNSCKTPHSSTIHKSDGNPSGSERPGPMFCVASCHIRGKVRVIWIFGKEERLCGLRDMVLAAEGQPLLTRLPVAQDANISHSMPELRA